MPYDHARVTAALEGKLDTTALTEEEEAVWFEEFTKRLGQVSEEEKAFYAALPGVTYIDVRGEDGNLDPEVLKMIEDDLEVERLADRLTLEGRQVGDHGVVHFVYLDGTLLDGAQMRFSDQLSDRQMRMYAAQRLLESDGSELLRHLLKQRLEGPFKDEETTSKETQEMFERKREERSGD